MKAILKKFLLSLIFGSILKWEGLKGQSFECSCGGSCPSLNIRSCSVGSCDTLGICSFTCQNEPTTTTTTTTKDPGNCNCLNCVTIPNVSFSCSTSNCDESDCWLNCGWITTTAMTTTTSTATNCDCNSCVALPYNSFSCSTSGCSSSSCNLTCGKISTTTITTSLTTIINNCNCDMWPGWSRCSVSKLQENSNGSYLNVNTEVDCYQADLATSPEIYIGQINQAQLAQIAYINNKTQQELNALNEKYAVADKVSSSVNVIAIASICLIYVMALLSDLMNLFPSMFAPCVKKKKPENVPGSQRPKRTSTNNTQSDDSNLGAKIKAYDSYFYNVEIQLFRALIKKKAMRKKNRIRHL